MLYLFHSASICCVVGIITYIVEGISVEMYCVILAHKCIDYILAIRVACVLSLVYRSYGTVALHFLQVYHLASVRMRDLCDRLEVDAELCSQTWTCFEYCLMQHTDLMKDRHLDQMLMCSVYVMAKVRA